MLKDSENYKKLSGNYISMKKDIETIFKNQLEMKNTLEGIKGRLDEAEDQNSDLEDKVGKILNQRNKKKRDLKRTRKFKGTLGQHEM